MSICKIIDSKTVENLKRLARKFKKQNSITHTEALEAVARDAGFPHWKAVTDAHKLILPTETAFRSGIILMYDIKDVIDHLDEGDNAAIINDPILSFFIRDVLYEWFRKDVERHAADDLPGKDSYPDDLLRSEFEEEFINNFGYFRVREDLVNSSDEKLLSLYEDFCFFTPHFILKEGELVN